MLHCVLRARVLALTGELHFPTILSACPRVPATLKIAASRAVQRRGSRRQSGCTCPIVHERSVSNFWFSVVVTPQKRDTQWGIEASESLAAARSGRLLRRHRIEQREQQQAGGEPADVGFPGDALLGPGQADRTDAEQQVQPEPGQ